MHITTATGSITLCNNYCKTNPSLTSLFALTLTLSIHSSFPLLTRHPSLSPLTIHTSLSPLTPHPFSHSSPFTLTPHYSHSSFTPHSSPLLPLLTLSCASSPRDRATSSLDRAPAHFSSSSALDITCRGQTVTPHALAGRQHLWATACVMRQQE